MYILEGYIYMYMYIYIYIYMCLCLKYMKCVILISPRGPDNYQDHVADGFTKHGRRRNSKLHLCSWKFWIAFRFYANPQNKHM